MEPRNIPISLDFRRAKAILRLLVCGASQDRLPQTAGMQRALARVPTAARAVSGSPLGKDSSAFPSDRNRAMHSVLRVPATRSDWSIARTLHSELPLNGFQ